MPTNFIVHVRTLEPGPFLGEPGDREGPVINAVAEALSNIGAQLQEAEYGPSPRVFPPWYIVIAQTSEVGEEDFKQALQDAWPEGQDQEGEPIPPADIQIQDQDAE